MSAPPLLALALFAAAGPGVGSVPAALERPAAPERAAPAAMRPAILDGIGIEQRIGRRIPLDAGFVDETGKAVSMGDYFGKRPVILAPVFFDCRTVCNLLLTGLTGSLKAVSLDAGEAFEVVAMSFDPGDRPELAAAKRDLAIRHYARGGGGFHYLTGAQPSIAAITGAIGYSYRYQADKDQYAHPAAIVVLTPDGTVSRYLFGSEFAPRDVRLALVEASEGRVGTAADRALLYCFEYDPGSGTYGFAALRALRVFGAATVLALGAFIVTMLRRERASKRRGARS